MVLANPVVTQLVISSPRLEIVYITRDTEDLLVEPAAIQRIAVARRRSAGETASSKGCDTIASIALDASEARWSS